MQNKAKTFSFLFILCYLVHGQSKKQKLLEDDRLRLQEEITWIKKIRSESKVKQGSILDKVADINAQIKKRAAIIRKTKAQANLLDQTIRQNKQRIQTNQKDIRAIKKAYASMISKSYRSKSGQSRMKFLLSSSDFMEAYKRLQYVKQYNKYRRKQSKLLRIKAKELDSLQLHLSSQKESKEALIQANNTQKQKLLTEKKLQKKLVSQIKAKQKYYAKQIQEKEAKAAAIEKTIARLIREAIAAAQRRARQKAQRKKSTNRFMLTPEETKLALKFTANKGKLPWPVGAGRLVKKFGKQQHPTIPNIQINSSGVEIETRSGEQARAIFQGEIIAIQKLKGANRLVQIRHGNYITTYYNVMNISVKEGQFVNTKQPIGTVRMNPKTGKAIMKFLIYQNTKKLNPQQWIYKM